MLYQGKDMGIGDWETQLLDKLLKISREGGIKRIAIRRVNE